MAFMARPSYLVTEAEALDGYRIRLKFEDQTQGTADLSDLVIRGGVFLPLRDPAYFKQARVDPEGGTVVWPNDADVAPEELYLRIRPRSQPPDSSLTAAPVDNGPRSAS